MVAENNQTGKENAGMGKDTREIRIIRGEEFKAQVRSEINAEDPFIAEYRKAAYLLEEIVASSEKERQTVGSNVRNTEYNNNIIAFCGNRGDGKSSAMKTFIHAVEQAAQDKDKEKQYRDLLLPEGQEFNEKLFVDTIYIDPSTLDNTHSVLDIVLAQMFRNFKEAYKDGRKQEAGEKERRSQRDELLRHFQEVYRSLAVIKDSKEILKEEFDDGVSLSKLSRLSDGMGLKEDIWGLFKAYFSYMSAKVPRNQEHCFILIAIDDLDMNLGAAYKMAEEIWKYLILPGVVIVMAVRIKQLLFCAEEYNIKQLKQQFDRNDNHQMRQEVQEMAGRYVAKLIPLVHRINLTKVQDFHNIRIKYDNKKKSRMPESNQDIVTFDSVSQFMLRMIYEKTGMVFLPMSQSHSLILPDNMRGMVSLFVLLVNMKNPQAEADKIEYKENELEKNKKMMREEKQNEIKHENIGILLQYYYREWLTNIPAKDTEERWIRQELEILTDFDMSMNIHIGISNVLLKIAEHYGKERYVKPNQTMADVLRSQIDLDINSLYFVVNYMMHLWHTHYKFDVWQYLAAISFLYTMKLNFIITEPKGGKESFALDSFTGHIIWGYEINNVMPYVANNRVRRGRFQLSTRRIFNCIANKLGVSDKYLIPTQSSAWKLSKVKFDTDEQRKKYIVTWILFGLLCNQWWNGINEPQMISSRIFVSYNYVMYNYQQVSVENYLLRLSMLDSLYEQLNLLPLGIQDVEVQNIINFIKGHNQEAICLSYQIVSNMDIMLNLIKSCRADYRQHTSDELDRSRKLVEDFFVKVENYVNNCLPISGFEKGTPADKISKSLCSLRYGEGKNETVNIVDLYAQLIQQCVEEIAGNSLPPTGNAPLQEFRDILEMKNSSQLTDSGYESFARYVIRESSLKTLQRHLMNMAKDISKYMILSGNRKYLSPEWKEQLCKLYEEVLQQIQNDPEATVTDSLREQYRDAARQFSPKALREGIDSLLEHKDTEIDF